MADVDKCADCGKRGATVYRKDRFMQDDKRSSPRCPICAAHAELAAAFKAKHYQYATKADCQRRDALLTLKARRGPRAKAKHCPNCHGYRPKDSFLRGSGLYGQCQLCRDMYAARMAGGLHKTFIVGTAEEVAAKRKEFRDAMHPVRRYVDRVDPVVTKQEFLARFRAQQQASIDRFELAMKPYREAEAAREAATAKRIAMLEARQDAKQAKYAEQRRLKAEAKRAEAEALNGGEV